MLTLARSPKLEVFTVPDTLPLPTRLEIAVAMLPDDHMKIARLLRDLGITGTARASDCPLSNYMRAALDTRSAVVYRTAIVFSGGYRASAEVTSTPAMMDFIEWFDCGFRQMRLRRALTA